MDEEKTLEELQSDTFISEEDKEIQNLEFQLNYLKTQKQNKQNEILKIMQPLQQQLTDFENLLQGSNEKKNNVIPYETRITDLENAICELYEMLGE